jgi:CDP-diacylglycerol--glycerol-3-phosphate 3-phosphatidyltransferase
MANFVTLLRCIIVILAISLLFWFKENTIVYLVSFVMTIIAITMDGLDGYIARKYKLTSKLGAVLDIIGDRIVENIYWIAFTALGWVSVWIPIVVVIRSFVVDGIRSIALEQGLTAFGKTTMMKSSLGKFLVASNFSRGAYAAFKGIAFSLLIIANIPAFEPGLFKTFIYYFAYISVYITVFLCIIRGLPVIIESKYLFIETKQEQPEIKEEKITGKQTQRAEELSGTH